MAGSLSPLDRHRSPSPRSDFLAIPEIGSPHSASSPTSLNVPGFWWVTGGPSGGTWEASCDSHSRRQSHVSQDVDILLRKSQTLIDSLERHRDSEATDEGTNIFRLGTAGEIEPATHNVLANFWSSFVSHCATDDDPDDLDQSVDSRFV
ncbi:hypothetical protein PoB_001722900 [Plakobranchus ocellatus]|uniref:Uncharacterized protein n=1 Tax=Plakobranchus ocellatus TaxID=259542 RepID=A0AAV3Z8H8_9GAST|nr:hypothetical protein PoB_001722900 [Plakobranchus ocellatus]